MLTQKDIESCFNEINKKLSDRGKYGEIVIAGGAALALLFNARKATKDIDALFKPSKEFREIIEEIAMERDLEKDWLNDGVKGFFTDRLKTDLYKEYSNLSIYSINAEGLLALKLTSARTETNDVQDSIILMKHLNIKNEEQLFDIVQKYTNINQQTPKCNFFIQEVFERYTNILDIEKDIKKSGFKPTQKLVENIFKLNQATDRKNTLKDIKKLLTDKEHPSYSLIKEIVNECKEQELSRIKNKDNILER